MTINEQINSTHNFIPVCEPYLNGNEKKYVADCMETGWISSSGKYVKAFEESLGEELPEVDEEGEFEDEE